MRHMQQSILLLRYRGPSQSCTCSLHRLPNPQSPSLCSPCSGPTLHDARPSNGLVIEHDHLLSIVLLSLDHPVAPVKGQTPSPIPTRVTTAVSLTRSNLVQHTSNPILPLTPDHITTRLQDLHAAASAIDVDLPSQTELELVNDMNNQGRGIMERWMEGRDKLSWTFPSSEHALQVCMPH
jgi:hypothetical protein